MGSFAASIKNWSEKAKRNPVIVFKSAVQKMANSLMSDVGTGVGATPFLTGNLRRSLLASTTAMPLTRDGEFTDRSSEISLTIAGLKPEDTVWLGFQANYARRLEYGFTGQDSLGRNYNQAGRFYVTTKANMWQTFVNQAAAELK